MDVKGEVGRSKRQHVDKTGRFAALQRLKELKGSKNKYELKEEAPVYEEIDEREYSRMVQRRQEDDWIVDDDGAGYVEDGREIFDDDLGSEPTVSTNRRQKDMDKKKFQPPSSRKLSSGKAGDIKNLFLVQSVKGSKKKPESDVKLDDDDLLGDIMQEIHNDSPLICAPKPTILKRKPKQFSSPVTPKVPINPFATGRTPVRNVPPKESLRPRSMNYEDDLSEQVQNTHHKSSKLSQAKENELDTVFHCEEMNGIEEYDENSFKISSQGVNGHQDNKTVNNDDELGCAEIEDFSMSDDLFKEVISENEKIVEAVKPLESAKKDSVKSTPQEESFEDLWDGSETLLQNDVAANDVHVDSSDLPLITLENGQKVLRFFWIDAYEDFFNHPGVVYLFGKVWIETAKAHVSSCVVVKNIERRVFLLPRLTHFDLKSGRDTEQPVFMKDVYMEFKESVAEKFKINEFKVKNTKKFYAFEKNDVPDDSEYLEVRYSAGLRGLPADLQGETFSHVFGCNTSSLETLLLDRKLKGPGWIDLSNPQVNSPSVSWCKIEALATKPTSLTVVQGVVSPPLVILSLRLCTTVNPNSHQNEIVAASCLVHHQFSLDKSAPSPPYQGHFCALTRPPDCIFPFDFKVALANYKHTKVERVDSERALLVYLLAKIQKLDPDIIVGHDIFGFDLDVLLHRMLVNKTPNWSRLGRLRRSGQPRVGGGRKGGQFDKHVTSGRLVCDVQISAKELIRCKSYDLTELTSQVLHQQRCEVPSEEVRSFYSSSSSLLRLVDITMRDADLVLRLMCELNILPLALQITSIAGNLMSRTLLGGRSERNEYLLLHAFHEKNFICPDKTFGKQTIKIDQTGEEELGELSSRGKRRKPAYAGGLVLEPKKGFYDTFILLMDFNSLYPSIIQEYNICFTTIPRTAPDAKEKDEEEQNIELPDPSLEPGVLPTEIRKLVESRRQVKQMMKAPDLPIEMKLQYDIRQKALKLTANSMYGCLGFTNSRFYAKSLASLITSQGRQILMRTKELVQKMGLDVIYGDTDSIMINTNSTDYDQVMKLGNKVKSDINKYYRQLEIDIDGVFKSMLLLKKKKYAALSLTRLPNGELTTVRELKGIDIVRRDWSELAKKAGEYVINEILSDKQRDEILDNIRSHLLELSSAIKDNKVPLADYTITKQLTKNPEDYPDKKNLSHVQVALRMNTRCARKLRQGDTVTFVICEDGSKLSATQRAYHPEELKNNDSLKIDVSYYLAQQIHPVVARLCDPIEGTDAANIAEFLGLDPTGYRRTSMYNEHNEDDALLGGSSQLKDEERFKDCERLLFTCPNEQCKIDIPMHSPLTIEDRNVDFTLDICPNASCGIKLSENIPTLCNQLAKLIRKFVQKYYQSGLSCEDPSCQHQTKRIPLRFTQGGPLCTSCEKSILKPQYTDAQLYLQLSYFAYLFDVDKATTPSIKDAVHVLCAKNAKVELMYRRLKETVDNTLRLNAYGQVNLRWLFESIYKSFSPLVTT